MPEGTDVTDMRSALAASVAEREAATSLADNPDMPSGETQATEAGEQASQSSQGQPAADNHGFTDEGIALGSLLKDSIQVNQDSSDSGGALTPESDGFWNQSVKVKTVNGLETVPLNEMRDGYLRQADYTQKTQALASERKHLEQAAEFLGAFESDPHGFVRSLAVQAGLIDEGSAPVKEIPLVAMPTQEEIDRIINEQVEARISEDPRMKDAVVQDAQRQVDQEFERLEKKFGTPLDPEVRDSVIREAINKGSADLEGIVAARLFEVQRKQSEAAKLNRAKTTRPGSPPSEELAPSTAKGKPLTFAEAFQQAKMELAEQ